jgi:hypothetical protein
LSTQIRNVTKSGKTLGESVTIFLQTVNNVTALTTTISLANEANTFTETNTFEKPIGVSYNSSNNTIVDKNYLNSAF